MPLSTKYRADPILLPFFVLNQYTGINTNTPSYDDDGNMLFLPSTPGGGKQFAWDGENRMITITNGNIVVVNTYDAQSRRIRKQVSVDGSPAKDIRYFYDAWNLLYEHDLLAGGSGSTRYYAWGLDLSQSLQGAGGVGGLLYTQAGASANAPAYDANGNATEYVDLATGAVTSRQAYDGFGKPIAQTGSRPAPYAFSTKYEDEETGLLYYGYRFFAPEIGRWPSRDPIGEMGSENLYQMVGNQTIIQIDLLGLFGVGDILGYISNVLGSHKGQGCIENSFDLAASLSAAIPLDNVDNWMAKKFLRGITSFLTDFKVKGKGQACLSDSCCVSYSAVISAEVPVGYLLPGVRVSFTAEGGVHGKLCRNGEATMSYFFCVGAKAEAAWDAYIVELTGFAGVKACYSSKRGGYGIFDYGVKYKRMGLFRDVIVSAGGRMCLWGDCGSAPIFD